MKPKVLLDTCAWLWINMDHPRIDSKARSYLTSKIWCISAISVWEIAMLVRKGRLKLTLPLRRWVKQALTETPDVLMLPLSPDVSIQSCELDMQHGDPADRIIIASALCEGIPLVTSDQNILREAKLLQLDTYELR